MVPFALKTLPAPAPVRLGSAAVWLVVKGMLLPDVIQAVFTVPFAPIAILVSVVEVPVPVYSYRELVPVVLMLARLGSW